MPEPATREEYENSTWFQRGREIRANREPLAQFLRSMRPGCWQYDAIVDGYDAEHANRKKPARSKTSIG